MVPYNGVNVVLWGEDYFLTHLASLRTLIGLYYENLRVGKEKLKTIEYRSCFTRLRGSGSVSTI